VPTSHRLRSSLVALLVVAPMTLSACSSTSGGGGSSSASGTSTATGTPTDSPSGVPSGSPSEPPTGSPTDVTSTPPRPGGNPSTVAPTPPAGVAGVTVIYTPTTAARGQKISIVATTDASLAGKPLYILIVNHGAPRVISTGSAVGSSGLAKTYAVLQRTGVLKLVIPATPLAGSPDSVGTYPFDPATPLLAESAEFTVTVA
jgi:hypothetical protein